MGGTPQTNILTVRPFMAPSRTKLAVRPSMRRGQHTSTSSNVHAALTRRGAARAGSVRRAGRRQDDPARRRAEFFLKVML
jgi:hypothetical protein